MRFLGRKVLAIGLWTALAAGHGEAAQAARATVTGAVRDEAGLPLSGVSVIAVSADTRAARTTLTSSAGIYTIVGLQPGAWRLTFELPRFRPVVHQGVRLSSGETTRIDEVLRVGGVEEAITVVTAAPVLKTESATLGSVIDRATVSAVPLNGRNFVQLAALLPGVALPPGSAFPRINGGRPRTNEYLFDGISVLQPEPGQVAFLPIIDAIDELRVESNNPPAEFGLSLIHI